MLPDKSVQPLRRHLLKVRTQHDQDLREGAGWVELPAALRAALARALEANGFSGMLYTETSEVPWMKITAASMAAPNLHFCTGIAVALPRSPMISAAAAWELAQNTGGRFRLGSSVGREED